MFTPRALQALLWYISGVQVAVLFCLGSGAVKGRAQGPNNQLPLPSQGTGLPRRHPGSVILYGGALL